MLKWLFNLLGINTEEEPQETLEDYDCTRNS